jgi:hypothetical protein
MYPDYDKIKDRWTWRCGGIAVPFGCLAAAYCTGGQIIWILVAALASFAFVGVITEVVISIARPTREQRTAMSLVVRERGPALFDRLHAVKGARVEPLNESSVCLRVQITVDYADSLTSTDFKLALASGDFTEEETGILRFMRWALSRMGHRIGTETVICSRFQPTSAFFAVNRDEVSRCQV